MKWFLFIILLLLVMILQGGSLLNFAVVSVYNIRPDFLIILFMFFALKAEWHFAIVTAFFAGFAADIISTPMGVNIVAFVLAGLLINTIQKMLLSKSLVFQGVLIFVVTFGVLCFEAALEYFFKQQGVSNFVSKLFITSLYTAAVGPFFWVLLESYSKLMGFRSRR